MKNSIIALLSTAALSACLAAPARADINFNFASTYADYPYYDSNHTDPSNVNVNYTDTIGAPGYAENGWFNSYNLGSYGGYLGNGNPPPMYLLDNNGNPTGTTLTVAPSSQIALNGMQNLAEQTTWDVSATPDSTLTPTDVMFNTTVTAGGGRTAEFQLQNVPYLQYNLVVYLTYSQYQSGSIQLFEGGTVAGAQTPLQYSTGLGWVPLNQYGGYPDSGYTQIISTDPTNPTLTGNTGAYVVFSDLTGANQTFDLVGGGGVAGFQIIDEPVPEPSTWAMIALGVVGLAGWRRFRQAK